VVPVAVTTVNPCNPLMCSLNERAEIEFDLGEIRAAVALGVNVLPYCSAQ
jgi:hypothetical protein